MNRRNENRPKPGEADFLLPWHPQEFKKGNNEMNKTKITKQTEIADSVNEEEEDQPIQDYLYQNRNKEQNKQCSSTVPTPKQIMKIELDEKRIMLEHKYSLEKMWDLVDEICSKTFLLKFQEGTIS